MHIFISAGEPSGDLHGSSLIRALQERVLDLQCNGYGGERMEAAGCRLLFPLCQLPVMWFQQVFRNTATFFQLIRKADRYFRIRRPDAVVLIDYPGLHWWLARRAKERGIPVFYFVPPQLWAWAGWRVRKMRRWVDHVLCTLPFEADWYRRRGVDGHYIGHPYFDELFSQTLDRAFLGQQSARPERVVAILPGSRMQELHYNLESQLRAAQILYRRLPNLRFLVAAFNSAQKDYIQSQLKGQDLAIEVHEGRTAEIIELATVCMAVSGSVCLELLQGLVPSVVIYRVHRLGVLISRYMRTCRWISLINLLAGEELFPEHVSLHCPAEKMAAQLENWLTNTPARELVRSKMKLLREEVGQPGASGRAADYILHALGNQSQSPPEPRAGDWRSFANGASFRLLS